MDAGVRLRQTRLALLVVTVLCAGFAAATVIQSRRLAGPRLGGGGGGSDDEPQGANPLDDPAIRKAAIAELVTKGSGVWDTFPDPEVGRVLQPNLTARRFDNVSISSNEIGLREKKFSRPKPPGTIRVVVLGDSFVLGQGIEAKERFGALLNDYFVKQAGAKRTVECLHFGLTCWNTVAETAFLKRSFSLVQPDLVIHLLIRNDLEDNPGARGFGTSADFDPLHGERGEPIFQLHLPPDVFGTKKWSWLGSGLDYESRSRFEVAGRRIKELATLVESKGGRYLLVDYYCDNLPASRHFITSQLRPEQVCYVTSDLARADDLKVDPIHWNAAGNEVIAKSLYWLIRERKLLPELELKEWPVATEVAKSWLPRGDAEAAEEPDPDLLQNNRKIRRTINLAKIDGNAAAQVTGGLMKDGTAGPYVSLILTADGAKRIKIAAHGLDRPELDGTKVEVFVEEASVGTFTVKGADPIRFEAAIPDEIAKRRYVSVRMVADDYAYYAPNFRQHVVFVFERIDLE